MNSQRILLTSLRFFSCSPFTLRGAHVVLFSSIMTFSLIECFQFVLSKIFIAKATKMLGKREKVISFNIVKSTLPVFAIFILYVLVRGYSMYVYLIYRLKSLVRLTGLLDKYTIEFLLYTRTTSSIWYVVEYKHTHAIFSYQTQVSKRFSLYHMPS